MFVQNLDGLGNPFSDSREWTLAEEIFRIRYHYAVTHAHGMERLAFRVLPYSVIRSLALTFDPVEPFRLGNLRIAAVNRTQQRKVAQLNSIRKAESRGTRTGWALAPNAALCMYPNVGGTDINYAPTFSSVNGTTQAALTWLMKDTTRRTRGIGEDMGELELFKVKLIQPNRHVSRSRTTVDCATNDSCALPSLGRGSQVESRSTVGGAAYITDATITSLRTAATTATKQVMAAKLPSLISATLPSAPRFSFAREVFELKDLPRSIRSLNETTKDLARVFHSMSPKAKARLINARLPKHVPDEYLSFWFGWMTTIKAVRELVEAPEKIAKQINFLILRRGKPTTLRRQATYTGGVLTTPGWIYQPTAFSGTLWSETALPLETACTFETEVRLVINTTFDFPGVGVPELREQLWSRKLGLWPTPSDAYAVVPWTWLIDWFTGLGNYVQVVDGINTDKKTINWGIATAVSTGKLRSTHRTYYDNLSSYAFRHNLNPVVTTIAESRVNTTTESIVEWKAQVREELNPGFGVRQLLKPESLTPYQQSIIGALLAQRLGKR